MSKISKPRHCYFCKHRTHGQDRQDLTKKPCNKCKSWSKFRRDTKRNY